MMPMSDTALQSAVVSVTLNVSYQCVCVCVCACVCVCLCHELSRIRT